MQDRGCMYVAFGRPYLVQALNSIRTLRDVSPGLPACIITNVLSEAPTTFAPWNPGADSWVYLDRPAEDNRLIKTDMIRYTPYERTLYLDCDTEVVSDLTSMFGFLDHWDVALVLKDEGYAPTKLKGRQIVLDGRAAVHELPHWNSGVLLFGADPRVREFFELWHQYFQSGGIGVDQVALVEAVFRSQCRILSLDARWNASDEWGRSHPRQKRYVRHYMHGLDDRIAGDLLALDRAVFQVGGVSGRSGDVDTESYVARRREMHARLRGKQNLWQRLRARVRSVLRRAKR